MGVWLKEGTEDQNALSKSQGQTYQYFGRWYYWDKKFSEMHLVHLGHEHRFINDSLGLGVIISGLDSVNEI